MKGSSLRQLIESWNEKAPNVEKIKIIASKKDIDVILWIPESVVKENLPDAKELFLDIFNELKNTQSVSDDILEKLAEKQKQWQKELD